MAIKLTFLESLTCSKSVKSVALSISDSESSAVEILGGMD